MTPCRLTNPFKLIEMFSARQSAESPCAISRGEGLHRKNSNTGLSSRSLVGDNTQLARCKAYRSLHASGMVTLQISLADRTNDSILDRPSWNNALGVIETFCPMTLVT